MGKNAHADRGWVRTHLKPNLTTISALVLAAALTARPVLAEEHAPAEGPAAEHGGHDAAQGSHGGGHHGGGGIENWFSLSFGPGKKHQNGPFAFAILNFVILVWLVVRFGKKPFVQYLENRHTTIRDNLAEAQRMREEAQRRLDEIKGKLKNLEKEISEIKAGVRKDAELEKERFIADARNQADALIKSADKALDDELRRARRMLEQEAVSAAMEAAEKLIRQKLDDRDRKRINEDYYKEIASSGGSPVDRAGGPI